MSVIKRRALVKNTVKNTPVIIAAAAISPRAYTQDVIPAGEILDATQMRILARLVDLILPQSDTPSASQLMCHVYIDSFLTHCEPKASSQAFISALAQIDDFARKTYGNSIEKLGAEESGRVLTLMANAEAPFGETGKTAFTQLKRLTLQGYYLSEAGIRAELIYLPIPGGYDPDFRLSQNDGRAFAPSIF